MSVLYKWVLYTDKDYKRVIATEKKESSKSEKSPEKIYVSYISDDFVLYRWELISEKDWIVNISVKDIKGNKKRFSVPREEITYLKELPY